jgi:hypothetical protein
MMGKIWALLYVGITTVTVVMTIAQTTKFNYAAKCFWKTEANIIFRCIAAVKVW